MKTGRKQLAGIVLAVGFLMVASNLRGADLYTYDLDSLIGMSSEVFEGKITGQHQETNIDAWEIQVSKAYAGDFTPGQKIRVMDLGLYYVSDNDTQDPQKLKQNDELFLFLDRAKSTPFQNFPTNADIYWPVPSGIRFVSGTKAVEFWQQMNPGPYIADVFRAETNLDVPTVAGFRRQIHESIGRVGRWNQLFKKKAAPEDIPALLALLRQRSPRKNDFRGRDYIAEAVCKQLADLQDPPALLEAARTTGSIGFAQDWTLGRGLATPDGRKQLIAKVADEHETISDRVKWAGLLGHATMMTGPAAFYEHTQSTDNHHENEHYLKRISELATNEQTGTNLQTALLANLRWLASVYDPNSGDAMFITEDGKDAETIVHSFWQRTDSQPLKYDAETILYPLSLVESNSTFGPVVAILNPADGYNTGRSLWYSLEYVSHAKGSWTAKVALINLKTGQKTRHDLSSNDPITSGQGGIGGSIDVPADFPSGRYRVFVEFYDGDKVVATSHYFETDL